MTTKSARTPTKLAGKAKPNLKAKTRASKPGDPKAIDSTPARSRKSTEPTQEGHPRAQAAATKLQRAPKPRAARADTSGRQSKQSRLIEMLRSPEGGTIEQMTALTGWQPHSVRGVISGVLRKRLRLHVRSAVGAELGARVYRIVAPAAV